MKHDHRSRPDRAPTPHPARSYDEALARIAALQALDGPEIQPACQTRLLTHGQPVERVVVLMHGYTNCPNEVARLGAALFDRGANVLIPRLPHHGLRDRMTTDVRRLTVAEQIALTAESIDIAAGLGTQIDIAGLCSGAVLAAWAAQFRPEVTRATLISPSLTAPHVPLWLAPAVMLLLDYMPNQFWWWSRRLKARLRRPAYAYPRFSTHALGEIYRLSGQITRAARRTPPYARAITFVTNDADRVINRAAIRRLIAAWQAHHSATITSYTFPAQLHLPHDLIDPHSPHARTGAVYPVLLPLIDDWQPQPIDLPCVAV